MDLNKEMNTLSLNSLWAYLQSLSLTTSNKKWLADHLYEAVKEETGTFVTNIDQAVSDTRILAEEELPVVVRRLIGVAAPATEDDIDGRKEHYSYLEQKYS